MISTMFRVSDKEFDVKEFLKRTKWNITRKWIKGKKFGIEKKLNQTSGFNLCILQSKKYSMKEYEKHLSEIIHFIQLNETFLEEIKRFNPCVDIGIIENESFMVSVLFEKEILRLAYLYDVQLIVTFYPCNSKK